MEDKVPVLKRVQLSYTALQVSAQEQANVQRRLAVTAARSLRGSVAITTGPG